MRLGGSEDLPMLPRWRWTQWVSQIHKWRPSLGASLNVSQLADCGQDPLSVPVGGEARKA